MEQTKNKFQSFRDTIWTCPFCGAQEKVDSWGVRHYGVGHSSQISRIRLQMATDKELIDYGYDPKQIAIPFKRPQYPKSADEARANKQGQLSLL